MKLRTHPALLGLIDDDGTAARNVILRESRPSAENHQQRQNNENYRRIFLNINLSPELNHFYSPHVRVHRASSSLITFSSVTIAYAILAAPQVPRTIRCARQNDLLSRRRRTFD